MESRANYALVGLFTLAVLAAAFGFVYWFNSGGAGRKESVRIIFTGTVTGLGRGSSVLFNGLRVGEVTSIELQSDDPRRIYAVVQVANTTPLREDTRARIEAQGLAGVAQRADGMLTSLDGLIKQNATPINNTVRNVEKFSQALGNNADGLDKLMAGFGNIAETIQPLSQKLQSLSEELTGVVRSVDRNKVASIIDNVDKFTGALGGSSADVAKVVKDAASISAKLDKAADQVEGVLKAAKGFLESGSGPDGRSAFQEVADAAKSIRTLADNLDKRTAEITAGISRFTGPGLRDVETLASDGKRTLTELNRTLRNFERNPQQFIFGGKPPLPQYNGSR